MLLLQRATHHMLQQLTAELVDLDLTPSEINALANLADGAARTVSELGTAMGLRPTTLTGVLDRLERRGHITRANPPGNRRSVMITLTDEGAAIANIVDKAFTRLASRTLRSLSRTERAGFHASLTALTKDPT